MNIAQNLERSRLFFPGKPAITFEGRSYTYRQLDEDANRLAHGLRALGIERGDRVGLFLPNIPQFAVAYFAAQKIGAIAVSLNALLKSEEVKYIINDAGAKALFTTAPQRQFVPADDLPTLQHIIIAEGEAGNDTSLSDLIAKGDSRFKAAAMEPGDPSAILYTSGTTGFPKGATLTHQNVVSNVYSTVHHAGMRPDDRLQLILPLFHCFGQNFILNAAINTGATAVLHRRFEPEPVLETIQSQRVSMFFAVPTIFIYFLNMDTSGYDLSSLRYCFTAAANMPPEVARRWEETYKLPIFEGYGLTECSPFASYNHDIRPKFGSIGMPIENVEMKIVDADGNEQLPGQWGEIIIKGPNVMQGYWNKPEATAAAIRNGWLHSGDIGMTDDEGYFFIVDRVKDMINAAGFNVYPAEVEHVIYKHPAVKEVAVYGVPDPVKGEAVQAAVVLKEEAAATEDEIIAFCRDNIAVYKAPRAVQFVTELPKSATGKILKRVLREEEE
ncbi:MAG: long-chain fatty acid--CoA ligase [Anaerolineae bacterium]